MTSEQKFEISGVSEIQWRTSTWETLSLTHDKEAINLIRAKVYLFSDSVLCVGGTRESPESNKEWERRFAWFKSSLQYRELGDIEGEPVEFEFQKKLLDSLKCRKEDFQARIILMSMCNDID